MEFGIMFFSSPAAASGGGKYRLLLEAAEHADRCGYCAVWTPERHFHEFGGLYPSPAVLSAALAMVTKRLQIRAGSLISPLHHDVRIAEEWSIVDNLSGGRIAISFGSGWNVDDFICVPDRYVRRKALMLEQLEAVRRLWRGDALVRENTFGKAFEIRLHPRPIQPELPVWMTSSGSVETFAEAGAHRANLLTHLIGQDVAALAGKIERYRAALAEHHGPGARGTVSLMLHTFLGEDLAAVRARVRTPFREYLRSAISLEQLAAAGGGAISGGHQVAAHDIPAGAMEELLDIAFERYAESNALLGTPASCQPLIARLEDIGVDEIACLIDFIDDRGAVMESLDHLDALRAACTPPPEPLAAAGPLAAFLEDLS